jgi:hypothetical protein
VIAAELIRIHTTAMGVPANFVHSIFPTYPRNHAYVAADRTPVASIVGLIRAGHAPFYSERRASFFESETDLEHRGARRPGPEPA